MISSTVNILKASSASGDSYFTLRTRRIASSSSSSRTPSPAPPPAPPSAISLAPSAPVSSATRNSTSSNSNNQQSGTSIEARNQNETATATHNQNDHIKAKRVFKRLAKQYIRQRVPPTEAELDVLWQFHWSYDWLDVIHWRDEVELKRGLVFEDGHVTFLEWPNSPQDEVIGEFILMFLTQFSMPWQNQVGVHPVFDSKGTNGNRSSI